MPFETFEDIQLAHRPQIESIRHKFGNDYSAYLFFSAFLWAKDFELKVAIDTDCYVFSCPGGYYFPCGSKQKQLDFIQTLKVGEHLRYLSPNDVAFLQENFPHAFDIKEDRDSYEYIYSVQEQVELLGEKYSRIRSIKNKQSKIYSYKPIEQKHIEEIKQILLNTPPRLIGDYNPTALALQYYEELSLTGLVFFKEETLCGCAIGSPINEKIFDLHILKTTPNCAINEFYVKHALCVCLFNQYQFLNLEEDLGIEGLRIKKTRGRPVYFNETYTACLKTKIG